MNGKKKQTRRASATTTTTTPRPRGDFLGAKPKPACETFAKQLGSLTVSKEDETIFTIEAMIDVMERAATTDHRDARACLYLDAEYELAWGSGEGPRPWLVAGKAFEAIRSLVSDSGLSKLRNLTASDEATSRPLDEAVWRLKDAFKADVDGQA